MGAYGPQMTSEIACWNVRLGTLRDSVCHFFWREYLTLKSRTCSIGPTGMGSLAAGLAASLVLGARAIYWGPRQFIGAWDNLPGPWAIFWGRGQFTGS